MPAQQSGWGNQQWQGKRNPQDEQYTVRQPGRRAPTWEQLWWEGKSHEEMRFGDWKCGNAPACRYPNFAYRDFCKRCNADAKWELPQDPRMATCGCGASIKPHYTGNWRACQAPTRRPDGGAAVYDPQGDKPLPAPNRGGNLQGHTAEPIMPWLEAVLNPAGPPTMLGDWPAPPYLDHVVARDREGLCFKVPFAGSTQVARIWEVDHNALCGKLLGHRRKKWADANPPPLFYLWHCGFNGCGAVPLLYHSLSRALCQPWLPFQPHHLSLSGHLSLPQLRGCLHVGIASFGRAA